MLFKATIIIECGASSTFPSCYSLVLDTIERLPLYDSMKIVKNIFCLLILDKYGNHDECGWFLLVAYPIVEK